MSYDDNDDDDDKNTNLKSQMALDRAVSFYRLRGKVVFSWDLNEPR